MKSTDIKNHKTSISQTHNLEVLGSSPSWSTLKIKQLSRNRLTAFFVASLLEFGLFVFAYSAKVSLPILLLHHVQRMRYNLALTQLIL